VLAQNGSWVVTVDVLGNEFQSPGKRAHDTIVVAFCMRNLARSHPLSEQSYPPLDPVEAAILKVG
jgi:hypothetical protein